MPGELVLTPSGKIVVRAGPTEGPPEGTDLAPSRMRRQAAGGTRREPAPEQDPHLERLLATFTSSQAEGLFTLAADSQDRALPATMAFWRDFAGRYVTELCHTPEANRAQIEAIAPLRPEALAEILSGAPPMPGGEYLNGEMLGRIWNDLDAWVRTQVAAGGEGLAGFLKRHAPLWHQVGRVCFHLAENKGDEHYPFAFLATYSSGLSLGSRLRYQPLAKALGEYAGAKNKPALVRLLAPVHRASEQSPFVRKLVDDGDLFHPLAWTPQEAYRFLKEVPLYEASGILVRLPDWWRKRPRPQVAVTIGENRKSSLGADSLLDFRVDLALDGERLTDEDWQTLMQRDDGLVLLRGHWVELDREKLAQTLDHWKRVEQASRDGSVSFIEGMRLLAGAPADLGGNNGLADEHAEWSFVRAGDWLGQVLRTLRNPPGGKLEMSVPGLQGTLRPYQETGVDWLWLLTNLGLGACLADDMGLGKTIQVLALLLMGKARSSDRRPSLLILPASLLANWKAEIERFSPGLSAVFVHPSETEREELARQARAAKQALDGADLVLTTYGMLGRQAWLADVDWNLVILDEAQAIKNPATRQSRAVKKLRAKARVALTGTPVENRLGDLWSLFEFLCPGLLGSAATFKQFVKRLDEGARDRYAPLRNLVRPYILRRLKSDRSIIADLPEKSEVKAHCGLSKRQAALYQKSAQELGRVLGGLDGIKRRGVVLSYLMRFKQICNHPSQLLGDGEFRASDSGKFARLAEIAEEIASRQEKALVFTQFREMTEPIHRFLRQVFGRPGLILHGGTAVRKRKGLIDEFQRDDGPPYFVLSLKAGGTGLNLTAASHVIHFDRWWNPAVENQATDRAFRIGQKHNVLVHKFVCRGTIEERIDQMIEEKRELAEDLLEAGAEKLLTEMSDQELLKLVALDVNKAMA